MKCIFFSICLFLVWGCSSTISEHIITYEGVKNADRKWAQKEFVLSTFRAVPSSAAPLYSFDPSALQYYPQAISTLKAANFNYIETAWDASQATLAILKECDKLGGMNVLAQDMSFLGSLPNSVAIPFHRDSLEKFLRIYGAYKSLKSVYIWDEPLAEQNSIVRESIDELEVQRPDLLGFTVLFPSYHPLYRWEDYTVMKYDEYVDKFIQEVNPAVLCTDYYAFGNNPTPSEFYRSLFWKDMGLFRNRAAKHNIPHWFYYQATKVMDIEARLLSPGQIMVQAWAAVMYGVKGLSSYTALGSVVGPKGEKEYLFEVTRKINSQLMNLGNTLLNLKSTAVYHAESIIQDIYASQIEKSDYITALPEHISVGEFRDSENNVYMLILNKDFNSAHTFSIPLKDTFRIYKCDKDNKGKQSIIHDATDKLPLELEAGEGTLIRIERATDEPKYISYIII